MTDTDTNQRLWYIEIGDYGGFLFEGTWQEAHDRGRDKARWEGGSLRVHEVPEPLRVLVVQGAALPGVCGLVSGVERGTYTFQEAKRRVDERYARALQGKLTDKGGGA